MLQHVVAWKVGMVVTSHGEAGTPGIREGVQLQRVNLCVQ
jgi:hypothetical protein